MSTDNHPKKFCLLHITSWNFASFYSGICTSFTQTRQPPSSCQRRHLGRQIRAHRSKSFNPNRWIGTVRSRPACTHLLRQVGRRPLVQKLCVMNQWVASPGGRRATKIWRRATIAGHIPVPTLAQKYVQQLKTHHTFRPSGRFTAQPKKAKLSYKLRSKNQKKLKLKLKCYNKKVKDM
jgi:hypothetical protein